MTKKSVILAAVVVAAISIGVIGTWIYSGNEEVKKRTMIAGQQKNCMVIFDRMWKIIRDKAGVSDQYKESFKDIYTQIMSERYGENKDGTLMKWITESNPNFDVSLYKDLSASIESERTSYSVEQKKLVDMQTEHTRFKQTFPYSIFIGSRPDVDIKLVTSAKTEKAYETGQDNEELFKK
ncbi:MAG TPA: hypothetical protein VEA58_03785 [Anaerovoracaceae bacterium]|nr:hypothetical protein [Anaerovoracaceae bacterium]